MKPHKWHKEIKAWADGAEIEYLTLEGKWADVDKPHWHDACEYRIKPKQKEPQYLYVYAWDNEIELSREVFSTVNGLPYIGKIKLEQDDE